MAGDWNGWDGVAAPLVQPVSNFPFYYLIVALSPPSSRSLYKFVRDGESWFSEPWARRIGWDEYGLHSILNPGEGRSHLQVWPFFSDPAGVLEPRTLTIYVPPDSGDTPLPVLYAHDGQNLFDPEANWGGWRAQGAADAAIASGEVQPFYPVGVAHTEARFDEYTHTPDDIGEVVGGNADAYVALLADAIKPWMDTTFPTLPGPEDTSVMGSSLGGLVSLLAIQRRPETFSAAASLSGTLGWGSIGLDNPTLMDLYVSEGAPLGTRLYLDRGGDDGGVHRRGWRWRLGRFPRLVRQLL